MSESSSEKAIVLVDDKKNKSNNEPIKSQPIDLNNVVEGVFVDSEVEEKAIEYGKQSASMVYTESGRIKTEALAEKIRKQITINPLNRADDWRVMTYLKFTAKPFDNLTDEEEKDRVLLKAALEYRGEDKVPIFDSLGNKRFPRDVQEKGFKKGFDEVVEQSPYKDEPEEMKPWYLQEGNLKGAFGKKI